MTKLTDALIGVTKLGLDTAPIIYFVERNPAYLDLVRQVLRAVDAGTINAHCSIITLTEVLTQPLRVGNILLADEYRDLLLRGRNLTM